MSVHFYKYHGAGNDFILIDNRENKFIPDTKLVAALCHRRFGIGADGLMLLLNHPGYDFRMVYYNSDGYEGTMCGNGGRCIAAFARHLGIIDSKTVFEAIDGVHKAEIRDPEYVELKMNDVSEIEQEKNFFFLNTGSPHYVTFTENLENRDVYNDGRKIRYNERFKKEGTNVNFVERTDNGLFVRTYERGVEDETLACGTGIVASAISAALLENTDKNSYDIKALGGNLKVRFNRDQKYFTDIWLEGPAKLVFEGDIETSF